MNPFEYITERQYSWARRHGISIDEDGYTEHLNDNLFLPLTTEVIREFPGGRQGNLGESIYAAHSSDTLVVNVFFYWRLYGNLGPMISALRPRLVNYDIRDVQFEARCPITWNAPPQQPRNPPQLDVLIRYNRREEPQTTKTIAIESKFREPYGAHHDEFAPCYLADENRAIWNGLEPLRVKAIEIQENRVVFERLHVAQLIKHILGLNSQSVGPESFELLYIWYDAPGPEAALHEQEISRFSQITDICDPRVRFRAMKYQDLIYTLARATGTRTGLTSTTYWSVTFESAKRRSAFARCERSRP